MDALYDAAIAGDVDAIALLEKEADHVDDITAETILHIESENGNTERVRFILREFANKNLLAMLNTYEQTALHLAIRSGHTEVAEVLIDAARRHLLSSSSSSSSAINLVTSFQAFLRQRDYYHGETALHLAVIKENVDIVKLLVEADPTDRHTQNIEGKTPMYIAVENGLNDIVEIISTTCTAPSLTGPDCTAALPIKNLDQVKSPGGTLYKIMDKYALYDAAIAGDADAIAELGMKADILNQCDETILHIESENGNTEHVRFILREFANKNLLVKLSKYKHTALHLAISRGGHTEVAEVLIEAARHLPSSSSANDSTHDNPVTSFQDFLRQGDKDMDTALHAAVMEGNMAIVKLLVEADPADRHIQNNQGKTPMYMAVEKGLNEIVEIISTTCTAPFLGGPDCSAALPIKNLDQVNSPGGTLYKIFDKDALYAVAIAGDADAISNLEMQADVLDEDGKTILHIESQSGNTERVRFILKEFPNKNLLAKINRYDQTALYLAALYGRTEVAEVLIDAARHLPSSSAHNNTVTSFQAFLWQGSKKMNTALHAAVTYGYMAIVKLLVEADPTDRHTQNSEGKTPIYIAAEKGYMDIVKVISTTCTAPLDLDGPGGTTVLHAAIKNGNHDIQVVEILIAAARLSSSASDNDDDDPVTTFQTFLRKGDEVKNTALHAAVVYGNVAIVKLLVETDPTDRHTQNKEGKTPIYIAAEKGYMDIVKVICTICTAPLNLDGPGGTTVLQNAIKNGNHDIEVVKVLIAAARLSSSALDDDNDTASDNDDDDRVTSFQAFLRKSDEDLNTALHIAVMHGNLATAKLLVEADPSDLGTQNYKGQTPFYIAVEKRHAHIVKMICTTCIAPLNMDGPGGRRTALHAVIKNLDEGKKEVSDVIKMILDLHKRELIEEHEDFDQDIIHGVLANRFSTVSDENGLIMLELAVERNYLEVVQLIMDVHNPAYEDRWIRFYFSSLMPLIYKAMDKGYNNIVEFLTGRYQAGTQLSEDHKRQASLISAIRTRNSGSVFDLLDYHGRPLVIIAKDLGWTALHHAAYHEFDLVLPAIVEAQRKYEHPFVYKNMVTPFYVAAEKGYTSTVVLLMKLWPSWSSAYTVVDKNGQNILHLAALQSKKEMIQGIFKYCSEEYRDEFVNKKDNNGNTPLHLLMRRGCFVPEFIRYEGIDIRVENQEKLTPPDMLYFEDQIIEDQVQIKMALEDMHINQKEDIFSSSVLPSKRQRKDVIFNKKAKVMIKEKHARMKEDTHAIANCFADAIAGDAISKAALEMEADILNEEGKTTILHEESMRGATERVGYIVREFAKINLLIKQDTLKQTALHLAAEHGHTQVVEVLIDAARHLPASSGNNQVSSFQAFIRQANGPMGNTALHLAVLKGYMTIVKLLLEADPNDSHVPNNDGKTPIYIAAENGHKDIVKEICTTCTALSLDGPGRMTALHALIQSIGQEGASDEIRVMVNASERWSSGADFEALFSRTDESGSTILQLAVEKNNVDAVRLIIAEDPACQHGREIKRNDLMLLIFKAIDNKCSDDIIKLLSQTYQVGISPDHKDVVALIIALKRRDEDSVLGHLRDAKQLVTFTDDNGWTPLHYAVYCDFDLVLGAIIQAQEEVKHQFVYGNMILTPFHVAVKCEYTSTLLLLMQLWPAPSSEITAANSPYTVVDENGRNILHLAAAADNRKEMVQGILKYCPEMFKDMILKQLDSNNDTPLHLLISHGCFIPELIKHKGLDSMAKNKDDFTPRDMLYCKNEIVADQVHIKIALDDVETNQSAWNFWPKSTEKKVGMWKSVVPPSKRRIKDVLFEERKKSVMDAKQVKKKEKLEKYKMRTNTQIIVTALITIVTFTVGFTMPGGLRQSGEVDEGLVLLSKKTAFNAFMVSDALALLLSTSSLFFYFLESMTEDPGQVSKLNAASTVLNIVSVMAMMLTFIAGTYVVLSHSPALAITVSVISSLFFLLIIVLLIKIVYDRQVKRNED